MQCINTNMQCIDCRVLHVSTLQLQYICMQRLQTYAGMHSAAGFMMRTNNSARARVTRLGHTCSGAAEAVASSARRTARAGLTGGGG